MSGIALGEVSLSAPIQRAPHPQARLLHHVRIDLRGLHALMSEQILYGPTERDSAEMVRPRLD